MNIDWKEMKVNVPIIKVTEKEVTIFGILKIKRKKKISKKP